MTGRRSRTGRVLGALGAPVLLFAACSVQSTSTVPSAPSAPGPAAGPLEDRSLEGRLRASGALDTAERIAQVVGLPGDEYSASLVEAWCEDVHQGPRWLLVLRGNDGSVATTDQLPACFYLASARVEALGQLGGEDVLGFVATDGGSGGWSEDLHLFKRAGNDLEPLGMLELSSSWRASGFDELCGAEKPHDLRTVKIVRRGDQLIVSGEHARAERTSQAGECPVTYRYASSPINETYALSPRHVERLR